MGMLGPTTNHDEIRRWAAATNAAPAEVLPYFFDSEPAILRFVFGPVPVAEGQPAWRAISWESFFAQFDLMGLALVYDGARPDYELLQRESESAYRNPGIVVKE